MLEYFKESDPCFSRTKPQQEKLFESSRVSWLMMLENSSFPEQTWCEISDLRPLLKWRQMYSKPRVQGTSEELIYKAFHTVRHPCLVLSLPPCLSCGFMWLVCLCTGINESLLVAFMSFYLPCSVCSSLSLTGPGRPLSSRMTTRTLGSSTTPTGNTQLLAPSS